MWTYKAPVADMLHLMTAALHAPVSWARMPAFHELDSHIASEVLVQAGRFAGEVLAPTNSVGDAEGCRLTPEGVRTPPGFREAYRAFVEGGWPSLACAPDAGGQGLPMLLNSALFEMLSAANHAWTMYPALLHGAHEVIRAHALPALRERYLPKIVSGEWLATMCLTEPQAGSDLGQVRARGELVGGGEPCNGAEVRITGGKIFISNGDHDLTDNIVHLVLFRLPGSPPGVKGLSLALAPKFLPDGSRNTVVVDRLAKKMGIRGTPTCELHFEAATGWLIGEPNRGLAAMFLMMNAARLHVGMQGLAHLEVAAQNAERYAAERTQMRAAERPPGAGAAGADPIAWHPAIRRNVMTQRARADGCRLIAYWTAMLLDEAEHHPEAAGRERASAFVALLTPLAKAFFTELGHRGADEALQVWGGNGYMQEYRIEQTVRDSRIAMIYEGTNEIQAVDLVQRKLLDDGGERARRLIDELWLEVLACRAGAKLAIFADALEEQLGAWRRAMDTLVEARQYDPLRPLRVADDMLSGVGYALLAWAWARIARTALDDETPWVAGARAPQVWLASAKFGVQWLLPQAAVHWHRVTNIDAELPWLAD